MTIRALVVDDEPLARERITGLLEEQPDFVCVGECGDGRSAVDQIGTLSPDVVFLDVQMPEMDGFSVLRAIPRDRLPIVVFVTAYDRYALRAFDAHALDYLLKPFDRERFCDALDRIRRSFTGGQSAGETSQRIEALLASLAPATAWVDRFVVKLNGRIYFVKTQDIDWIEAAGNYVRLHVGKETHLVRETMNSVESRLDPHRFVRIHRSAVVCVDRIKELHPWFHGEYAVILKSGEQLTLSRSYRSRLRELLGDEV